MKELTAAQGLLRCGECNTVFDAMKTLSATLPEERRFSPPAQSEASPQVPRQQPKPAAHRPRQPAWPLRLAIALLTALLLVQILYASRHWLAQQPLTAPVIQKLCAALYCSTATERQLERISLISRNVYSHPNTPGILTISAIIQNDAATPQPFPLVAISFRDTNGRVLALRRFKPAEYLKNFQGQPMPPQVPQAFSLHITDPGESATRFQLEVL